MFRGHNQIRSFLSYTASLIILAAHLDVHPLEIRYLLGEPPSIVNRTRRHLILGDDPVGDGDPVIVLSKRRSLVDDTRPRGGFDVAVADDSVGSVFELKNWNSSRRTGNVRCFWCFFNKMSDDGHFTTR